MSEDSLEQALTDDELGELSAFLRDMGTSLYNLDNLESVDGFFSALICVPGHVDPSRWLLSMGEGGFVIANPAEEARIMELFLRYWNTVARNLCLITTEPRIFIEKYSQMWRGSDWSSGFIRGILHRPMLWGKEPMTREEAGELVMPMVLLTADRRRDQSLLPSVMSPEKREVMFPQALKNLTIIYSRFESLRRATPSLLKRRDDRPEGPLFVFDNQAAFDFRRRKLVQNDIFRRPNSFDADDIQMCKFFNEDTDDFPLKCPACRHEFLVKVGSLKSRTYPPCPICGLPELGDNNDLNNARTNHFYLTHYMNRFKLIEYDKNFKQFRKTY